MALTPSQALPLQTPAPDFNLPDTTGRSVSLSEFTGSPLLVAFICNHCPYVKHLADAFSDFAREYQRQGLAIVAINANDADNYPDDAPDKMVTEAASRKYSFPYLHDADQSVARAYHAACTPEFFLFDKQHRLVYHGQFDDSRPNQGSPTGSDLRNAASNLLAGKPIPSPQKPSTGCNIKWKPGHAPA